MIEKLTRRRIAVLGLAVLGGCAGPGASGPKPPPSSKAPLTASPTALAPADRPVALPSAPPRPETESGATVPPPRGSPAAAPGRGTTAQAAPARPITAPARTGRQIVLNFDNADIEAVIQAASEIAGFNYTIGPGVAGKKVTIQTSGRIPEDEVFNVLLAVLEVNGVTAVAPAICTRSADDGGRERPLPTVVGAQADPTRRDDEVITQIVPLQYVPADRVAATLRPFIQGGNLVVQGSLLIITDTAANVARILQIVGVLDVEVATDDLRLVPIRFADAVELARILNEFFSGRRVRTSVATVPAPAPAPAPRAPPAAPGAAGAAADSGNRPL
jgi:general secretion pathway protein D